MSKFLLNLYHNIIHIVVLHDCKKSMYGYFKDGQGIFKFSLTITWVYPYCQWLKYMATVFMCATRGLGMLPPGLGSLSLLTVYSVHTSSNNNINSLTNSSVNSYQYTNQIMYKLKKLEKKWKYFIKETVKYN